MELMNASEYTGVVGGSNASYERLSFRLNGNSQIKEWMNVGNTLTYSHSAK